MENVEILKSVLSEDTYNKVVEETGKCKIKLCDLSSGEFVSKSKYDALETQLVNTQGLLETKTKDYDTLQSKAGDNQALKDEIESLKTAHAEQTENLKKDYEAQLKKNTVATRIISDYRPKDVNDIMAHIDLDKITIKDDEISGLSDQVDVLKENKAYYFEDTTSKATGFNHGGAEPPQDDFIKGFNS